MKSILILLSVIFLIKLINGQIVRGPSLAVEIDTIDIDFGEMTTYKDDLTNKYWQDKIYARYDWGFIKFYLHNNYTGFTGSIDFHPRVDEFTTLKIPNTQELMYYVLNETNNDNGLISISERNATGYTVWAEIPQAKNITVYSEDFVSTQVPCFTDEDADGVFVRTNITQCANIDETLTDTIVTVTETVSTNTTKLVPITLPPKRVMDLSTRTFVGYFTIIIQLDKGKIIDAQWDGDRDTSICEACDSCIDNQCAVNYDDMQCDYDNGCQLRTFVAWSGIDRNSKSCQSINKIPSKFQKYSSTSVKKMGTGLLSDFFYRVNENNNNPNQA